MVKLGAQSRSDHRFARMRASEEDISMSIGTLLRVLFSLMSFLVTGLLLQPIWGDLRQRTAGSAAAPATRCRNCRRRSFIDSSQKRIQATESR